MGLLKGNDREKNLGGSRPGAMRFDATVRLSLKTSAHEYAEVAHGVLCGAPRSITIVSRRAALAVALIGVAQHFFELLTGREHLPGQ